MPSEKTDRLSDRESLSGSDESPAGRPPAHPGTDCRSASQALRHPENEAASASLHQSASPDEIDTQEHAGADTQRMRVSESLLDTQVAESATRWTVHRTAEPPARPAVAAPLQTSETRTDPISGEWTLFAAGRAARPDQFGMPSEPSIPPESCPFCHGNEDETPPPVWTAKVEPEDAPADEPWSVRVVPNLYPAVNAFAESPYPADDGLAAGEGSRGHTDGRGPESPFDSRSVSRVSTSEQTRGGSRPELFLSEPARGGHEVIIESSRHTRSFSELNPAEMAVVFQAYANRLNYWRNVAGVRHISIFKNVGRDAGASLQHSHSQLIATSRVPASVDRITRRMQAHHARYGSCVQCDVLRSEIQVKERLVCQTQSLVAYTPYASRFPWQVRITSREHQPYFESLEKDMLEEVSQLTLRVVRWLEAMRPGSPYNMLLFTSLPAFDGDLSSQHWGLEIFPRVSRIAGYELSSNCMINPVYPEAAAAAYRQQARLSDPRHALR